MNYRFITKAEQAKKTTVELVRKPKHYQTTIHYPTPDPRDRVRDEYEDDESE